MGDDEIQRWSRETVEGREFFKACDKTEATHATSSLHADTEDFQTEEEEVPKNFHQPHQAIRAKEVEHIEAGEAEPGDEARTQAIDIHQYPPDNPRILTE